MPSPRMKSGQRKLSEVARHLNRPAGIVSTGWPAVRDRLAEFGIPFDLWQQGAGRLILAKRADGMYAAGVGGVVISIPRQVGKTYMIGWIVFALCTLFPGMTVIWTAHHTRTSTETFGKMKAMAQKAKVAPYIENVRSANGEQAVLFKNASRILFGARDQGFGLGFDMVDILVLDEAQRVKEAAMNDMVPATNAAPNGLVFLMGTPPRPTDSGEVFTARRKDALAGDPDTMYLELSADPDAKIIDWAQVEKANPSYPHRTTKTAILRMQKLLGSDEGFLREAYGIWEDYSTVRAVIPFERWSKNACGDVGRVSSPVVAVDVRTGLDQSFAISVVGSAEVDGVVSTVADLAAYEVGRGRIWPADYIVGEVTRVLDALGLTTVVVDKFGDGNGALIPLLEQAGFDVLALRIEDMRNATVGFVDENLNGRVWHVAHEDAPALDIAVKGAVTKASQGGFLWNQAKAGVDLTPLRAMTAAWWVFHSQDADYDVSDSFF